MDEAYLQFMRILNEAATPQGDMPFCFALIDFKDQSASDIKENGCDVLFPIQSKPLGESGSKAFLCRYGKIVLHRGMGERAIIKQSIKKSAEQAVVACSKNGKTFLLDAWGRQGYLAISMMNMNSLKKRLDHTRLKNLTVCNTQEDVMSLLSERVLCPECDIPLDGTESLTVKFTQSFQYSIEDAHLGGNKIYAYTYDGDAIGNANLEIVYCNKCGADITLYMTKMGFSIDLNEPTTDRGIHQYGFYDL